MPLITVFRREERIKKNVIFATFTVSGSGIRILHSTWGHTDTCYRFWTLTVGTLFIPGSRELRWFDDLSGAVGMFRDSDPDPATQKLLRGIQADPDPYPKTYTDTMSIPHLGSIGTVQS
jgi:hypothetical protein